MIAVLLLLFLLKECSHAAGLCIVKILNHESHKIFYSICNDAGNIEHCKYYVGFSLWKRAALIPDHHHTYDFFDHHVKEC